MLKQKQIQAEKVINTTKVQDPERFVALDNKLLQFGINHLSSPAIKILYLVIARYMNSEIGVKHPVEIDIPIAELKQITTTIDNKDNQRISKELMAGFKIPNGIIINGENYDGELSWFSKMSQVGDKIRFQFNPLTFERILHPHFYTTLYRPELDRLKTGYAIKVFQVLRGIQNRRSNWHEETRRKFSIERLKNMLGISHFKKLDKATIQSIIEEINRYTNLQVSAVIQHPESGEAEAYEFIFKVEQKSTNGTNSNGKGNSSGGGSQKKEAPKDKPESIAETIENLTWTQQIAFNELVTFGISQNIVLGKILPVISKGEIIGFEDIFVTELLAYFKTKTPKYDADTFVKWWAYSDFFHPSGEIWQSLLERVIKYKKALEAEMPAAFLKRIEQPQSTDDLKKKNPFPTIENNFPIQKHTIS